MNGFRTPRLACLARAGEAVTLRAEQYGAPADLFAAIAARWSLRFGHLVTPRQVALCLLDLKIVRADRGPHLDSCDDIAGYGACLAEIDQGLLEASEEDGA